MHVDYGKLDSIFYPRYLEKIQYIKDSDLKFVQYTSAEAAMSIIQNREVWLRNVRCMNDYNEVQHGLNCLRDVFRSEQYGRSFQETLDSIFPNIIPEFLGLFNSRLDSFKYDTYILCVSEHPKEENEYGRLSMWRAYGGKRSVALVLNPGAFASETDIFHAYTNPVSYQDAKDFGDEFKELTNRIINEQAFIKSLGKDIVIGELFEVFKNMVVCAKHPGFKEEREWRVVYNPILKESQYLKSEITNIEGTPQEIHKVPLKNYPEHDFYGATLNELIERIIIGPSDQQVVLGKTFERLLDEAGIEDPSKRIQYSGIPLRES